MNVSLHTSALAATADEAVFLPWLENVARTAAQTRRPTAVLVPQRADAYALKSRALTAGLDLFGVHFFTPGEVRDRLSAHLGLDLRVPLREHLRLLLATAAERVAERRSDDATASVAAAPDQLLKAIDIIGSGGWSFAKVGPPRLRPTVAEFEKLIASAGFTLVHEANRSLFARTRNTSPLFAALFVTHFNALHWPHWPLLEAAVRAAESATVCLTDPRDEAQSLDAAWVGTWEQSFGAASPIAVEPPAPATAIDFLVGQDTTEQARAIVTKALHFLADAACERLGILFPAAGALSRRVAALLATLEVPHYDGLAHQAPGPLEDAAWPAWLALQENPRLPALLAFLRARPGETFAGLPLADAEDQLTRTFQEVLFDDLALLAEWLARHPRRASHPILAEALRTLPFLPEQATLGDFLKTTHGLLCDLGWPARADELERVAAAWESSKKLRISRRSWLRWLGETLVSWRPTRDPAGRHPYSRLHLLPYAQAESQGWTHLIAAGLNEGQWPPRFEEAGYLGEEEIDALNRGLRALNVRATMQGRQGEGHVVVPAGYALCLGSAEHRALVRRQFFNTLEATTVALAIAASQIDETAPERPQNPSEFFNERHVAARGRAVSQDTMNELRRETVRWLEASALWSLPPLDTTPVRQTRLAFDARRRANEPFGEYQFAFRIAPTALPHLTATEWENAIRSPALVWMSVLLGVGPGETNHETPWSLTTGQWAHHWLAAATEATERGAFAPWPEPGELRRRVFARAENFRERVTGAVAAHGRVIPEWWISAWDQARRLTAQFLEQLEAARGQAFAATERTLPDTAIAFGGNSTLHVRGRTDLLLADGPPLVSGWPEHVWVVDYKTGKKKPLDAERITKGDGLQLALYALALRQCGVREVGASIFTPTLALDVPQITAAQLDGLVDLWRGLHSMQQRGAFGQLGALRDDYAYRGDYPLATLAIDPDMLDEKWARTHPALAGAGEEESA